MAHSARLQTGSIITPRGRHISTGSLSGNAKTGRQAVPSVLAIDAAWTVTEPSGITLLDGTGCDWTCLALAPSYEGFIQLSRGFPLSWGTRSIRGCSPNVVDLLQAARIFLDGRQPDLVTIDMPISTVPITGRRAADNHISKIYGGRGCSAHTPSTSRPGTLGASLFSGLATSGYELATRMHAVGTIRRVIEVYPHPALLTLLNEVYRVPYKVSKSNKYWPGMPLTKRISNLLGVFERIKAALDTEISSVPLLLPATTQVETLSILKRTRMLWMP